MNYIKEYLDNHSEALIISVMVIILIVLTASMIAARKEREADFIALCTKAGGISAHDGKQFQCLHNVVKEKQ